MKQYIPNERTDNKPCKNKECKHWFDNKDYQNCEELTNSFLHNCRGYIADCYTECPYCGAPEGMLHMHGCKYIAEQEQEERSCENCKYNKAPNDEKPCWTCDETLSEWKPKQNQPEQKPSAEWELKNKSQLCWEGADTMCVDAVMLNHLKKGINVCLEKISDLFEWVRINSNRITENYMEHDDLSELREEISVLKERFDKAEVRYCKQWEMISSINDKLDQLEGDNK